MIETTIVIFYHRNYSSSLQSQKLEQKFTIIETRVAIFNQGNQSSNFLSQKLQQQFTIIKIRVVVYNHRNQCRSLQSQKLEWQFIIIEHEDWPLYQTVTLFFQRRRHRMSQSFLILQLIISPFLAGNFPSRLSSVTRLGDF